MVIEKQRVNIVRIIFHISLSMKIRSRKIYTGYRAAVRSDRWNFVAA